MMIEAFDEVSERCRRRLKLQGRLLKQKQTQAWKTTKATADAVYAPLARAATACSEPTRFRSRPGRKTIKPENVEAGTGFYEQRFLRGEITPAMGRITVRKADEGVSWGSVHWQYLEDMAKVTPHEGTPLKLTKTLFVKETTKKGQVLVPVNGPLSVGDELVVRIELRTDRDMEYVHLKDQRASGTEPVDVLSGYRFQDGLAYYESTRDSADHFFIDYLPKGVYVFEYSTRVQLRGSEPDGSRRNPVHVRTGVQQSLEEFRPGALNRIGQCGKELPDAPASAGPIPGQPDHSSTRCRLTLAPSPGRSWRKTMAENRVRMPTTTRAR